MASKRKLLEVKFAQKSGFAGALDRNRRKE